MKSLAEREAFRRKQRAEERKDPEAQKGTRGDEESQRNEGSEGGDSKGPFEAKALLGKSVADVSSSLAGLSNDELVQLRAEEMAGKKRAGIIDAISSEENKRKAATSSWNRNA